MYTHMCIYLSDLYIAATGIFIFFPQMIKRIEPPLLLPFLRSTSITLLQHIARLEAVSMCVCVDR
jgi:hypothetical protein